jgi:hypothetical protein
MAQRNHEKEIDVLLLIGIAKLFSEQSTFLIGELSHEKKQWFNNSVKAVDNFMRLIENDLNDHNKKTLLILTESLNEGIQDLRKILLNDLK